MNLAAVKYALFSEAWLGSPIATDFAALMDDLLSDVPGSRVLLIGTGETDEQYRDWPDALMAMGARSCTYLEAHGPNVERWDGKPYPVIHGDVRRVGRDMPADAYDVALFIQGPEHLERHEIADVAYQLSVVARRAVVMTAPWGSFYDAQDAIDGNPYERHLSKSLDVADFAGLPGFTTVATGTRDGGDGALVVYWKLG